MTEFEPFDFGGPLPPDCPDGGYMSVCKKATWKQTKAGDPMAVLEFLTVSTEEGDAEAPGTGRRVTYFFMPKKRSHKYFNMFAREVQQMCKCFGKTPPKVDPEAMGTQEGWAAFVDSLVSPDQVLIFVKNEARKDGNGEDARVKFASPGKKVGPLVATPADED